MITDLTVQDGLCREVETDVAIVGAGIAGLVLAIRLRRQRVRVLVLESGGLEQVGDTHPLNRVIQLGDVYSGATHGRFRCLGGTSTRWGGALLPFLGSDLLERPHVNLPAFPVGIDVIQKYLAEVEALFGLDPGSYEEDFVNEVGAGRYIPVGDTEFRARFAKWPPFKKRNIAALFDRDLRVDSHLEVMLNATVTEFQANREKGRVLRIRGSHPCGKWVDVKANHFVICAGAIETTRLLLLFDRQCDQRIFASCEAIGHYFFDHISARMAEIRPRDIFRLNRMAGFRFVGSTMRSLRFELMPSVQKAERIGSANGHISFRAEQESGFEALRQLMRGKQRGAALAPKLFRDALRDLPYLTRLSFWRAVHRQLLWPKPAVYELHAVIEQMPRRSNFIELAKETDAFGLPLAAVNWRIAEDDHRTFAVFKRHFETFWIRRGLTEIGELAWANDDSTRGDRRSQADVFHPGGSTRIGLESRLAVLDPNLQVFGVPNLWAASTAAFPSGGGANPTLTLMLFTMRLADHLAGLSNAKSSP